MSLTAYIRIPPVRRRIRKAYSAPDASGPLKPKVPRLSSDPRLIGTAFDYALRFFVEQLNPLAASGPWIAERFVRRVEDCLASGQSIEIESGKVLADGRLHTVYALDSNPQATLSMLQNMLAWAKDEHRRFLAHGIPTNELMKACCVLARFDWMGRAQYATGAYINRGLDEVEPSAIRELRRLLALVKSEIFLAESRCILNPVLRAGALVGGADADLLIDDRLIDIKVSESRKPDKRDWDQLIGYYGLCKLGGIVGLSRRPKVRYLGIYNARFATYYGIDLRGQHLAAADCFANWLADRLRA